MEESLLPPWYYPSGRMPEDVCFNPEVARKLPHKPLFKKKKIVAGQPLHPEEKQRVFQLASNPDNFYPVVVSLQVSPSPLSPLPSNWYMSSLQTYQFNVDTDRDSSGNLLIHTAVQGGEVLCPQQGSTPSPPPTPQAYHPFLYCWLFSTTSRQTLMQEMEMD